MKDNILSLALENVQENTPLRLDIKEREIAKSDYLYLDAILEVYLSGESIELQAEIRKEIRKHQLPKLYNLAEEFDSFVLIAGKISKNIKEKLKQRNINWIDAAGNVFIRKRNYFIYVDHGGTVDFEKEKDRAFTKTGLKVLFLFLQDESWVQKTYREISYEANVSLGSIGYVVNGLKKRGYLVRQDEKKYQLIRKEELFDQWLSAFENKLNPDLKIGRFEFVHDDLRRNWKDLDLGMKSVWGGEAGAELVTNIIKPKILTLYTMLHKGDIMNKYKLKPTSNGSVEVKKSYWKIRENSKTAPALAIYADLMLSGQERNFKVAEKICEKIGNEW